MSGTPKIVRNILNTEYADLKNISESDFNNMKDELEALIRKINAVVESNNLIIDYDQDTIGRQDDNGNTLIKDISEFKSIISDVENGTTLKFENDVDLTNDAITITNKEVVFDLAGTTITSGNSKSKSINVSNGGKLTLTGGTIVSDQPYSSSSSSTSISVEGTGELIIDDIKFEAVFDDAVNNGQFGIGCYGDGNLTINGGDIKCGWYCVTGNGSTTNENAVTVINGGKFVSTVDFAIYHPGKDTITINGGEFVGGAGAISANGGNVIINGGTFKSNGDGDTGEWSDGTSGQADATINLNGKYSPVNLTITGGTFISVNNVPIIIAGTKNPVTVSISGGKFNVKPNDEFIAEGYAITDEPDSEGYYEVIELVSEV